MENLRDQIADAEERSGGDTEPTDDDRQTTDTRPPRPTTTSIKP